MTRTKRQASWPRWIFIVTLFGLVLLMAGGLVYYAYGVDLGEQSKELADLRASYDAEINRLEQNKMIENTVSRQVQSPVQVGLDCIDTGLFGGLVRASGCAPRFEMRTIEVKEVVRSEDPTVKSRIEALRAELTTRSEAASKTIERAAWLQKFLPQQGMKLFLSVLAALASLFVILSKHYEPETEKWAFATMGTVLGYWLK